MKNYSSTLSALQHIVEQTIYLNTKPSRIQCSGKSRYVKITGFPQIAYDFKHMVPLKLVNIKSALNISMYVYHVILLFFISELTFS
jgi:hypothetical protein